MNTHIVKFIDRIKASESRGQRDFIMTLTEAKDLHADITKLLIKLQESSNNQVDQAQVIEVRVQGGTF